MSFHFFYSIPSFLIFYIFHWIGISPAARTALTGFALTDQGNPTQYATSLQVTGKVYGPAALDQGSPAPAAQDAVLTAYNTGVAETNANYPEFNNGVLDGQVLIPGLYIWTTTVTLGANAVVTLVVLSWKFWVQRSPDSLFPSRVDRLIFLSFFLFHFFFELDSTDNVVIFTF